MIVCSCHNISNRRILEVLFESTEALSVKKVSQLSEAGTGCGTCLHTVAEIVETFEACREEVLREQQNAPNENLADDTP